LLMIKKAANVKKRHLVTYSNPDSKISDQFRTIRSNLQFLTEETNNRTFVITSTNKSEGKSTSTANLAVSMAQQSEKVLLIDASLREPIIHTIFKIPNELGLTDILSGKISFENTVQRTEIGKLDILTSGSYSSKPAELLGSEEMATLLQMAAASYDIVLIDSPSVLEYTETRVLANQCDGVVVVINRGKTALEKAVEAKRVLELAQANLVGAIINEK
jgi:capsular exopolysaccharide synthesis family protein